jgi:hypothetical protein
MWLNFVSLSGFMTGPSQTCINMCNAYGPNNGANCSANILHSLSLLRFPYFLQLAVNRHFETEQGNKIFPSKNTHHLILLPIVKQNKKTAIYATNLRILT